MGVVQLFVGCIDAEERANAIIRNGKDNSMVGFSFLDYQKGAKVWTNFSCNFAEHENMGMQAMIDELREKPVTENIILCVSEIGDVLDSCGSETNEVLFINGFLRQLGKIGDNKGRVVLRGTVQRFFDLQKRLRIHTSNIMIPAKFHYEDNRMCNSTKCLRRHYVKVYSYKPFYENPIKIFDATNVGEKYNTYQRVYDKLKIPSKKQLALLEREENNKIKEDEISILTTKNSNSKEV